MSTSDSLATAARLDRLEFSAIRKVFEEARALQSRGLDIARMEIGRPDFDTPDHIKRAAVAGLDAGEVHYAPNRGTEQLRRSIAAKLARDNDVHVDPDTGVLVTIGCKEAIFLSLAAFLDEADEILVPDPSWDAYRQTAKFFGGVPVSYPLFAADGFQPDPSAVAAQVSERTKILVLISPHNPTGVSFTAEALEGLARIAVENDLLVISDEIYEKLVYGDTRHRSIATLPGMAERTIVINGFSKAYAMDGWRIGYAAGPERLIRPMLKVHQYTTNCVTTFVQRAAVAAYDGDQESVRTMREELDRRRRMLVARLREMPGVSVVEPSGAFYAFPRFDGMAQTSVDLAALLLREAHIACVPGSAFGSRVDRHLRFSYATTYDSIERGMDRLRDALLRLIG